jgi:flagellar protein FlaG
MSEVKLSVVETGLRAGLSAAKPQQESQQSDKLDSKATDASQKTVKAEQLIEKSNVQAELSKQALDEQLEVAVTQLNDYIQTVQRDLQFKTDDASGKTVVTVIDRHTSEVVRQIPDEVALTLAQKLQQDEPLSLFNIKA